MFVAVCLFLWRHMWEEGRMRSLLGSWKNAWWIDRPRNTFLLLQYCIPSIYLAPTYCSQGEMLNWRAEDWRAKFYSGATKNISTRKQTVPSFSHYYISYMVARPLWDPRVSILISTSTFSGFFPRLGHQVPVVFDAMASRCGKCKTKMSLPFFITFGTFRI